MFPKESSSFLICLFLDSNSSLNAFTEGSLGLFFAFSLACPSWISMSTFWDNKVSNLSEPEPVILSIFFSKSLFLFVNWFISLAAEVSTCPLASCKKVESKFFCFSKISFFLVSNLLISDLKLLTFAVSAFPFSILLSFSS